MARTIDERIVQMTFNSSEFEQKAGTAIQTLQKLKTATDTIGKLNSFGGLQAALNKINFSSLTGGIQSVNQSFSAFETIAIGALLRVGNKVADLGTNLVKSLTIQQPIAGWTKYNEQTQSVQTLVNSTGKSVEEIDGYLDRLMWYSDETSFSFTEMTKALSTMVSSGGDIDTLIPMIMGIGNATAYAGKAGAEFQRVIYNLNQSYSQGFLNRQDWKSIELAGVDSKVLKEQLMAAAVELKTITKSQADISKFNDLLTKKAFSRDVMEKAFGSFAQMTLEAEKLVSEGKFNTAAEAIESLSGKYDEFAERAFKSAQEAKSFSEAIEATKDAVSSGWMQTFKIIFGNYNESKALWTDLTNTFWEIFASGAKKRNDILSAWKDIWTNSWGNENNGSRRGGFEEYDEYLKEFEKNGQYLTQTQALLGAISGLILQIRDDISRVFESVFPFPTILDENGKKVENFQAVGQVIYNIVEKIRGVFLSLTRDENDFGRPLQGWTALLEGILQVVKTLIEYAKVFVSAFVNPLRDTFKPVFKEIVDLFTNLGRALSKNAVKAREDLSPFQNFLEGLLNVLQPIITLVTNLLHWINELISGVEGVTVLDGIFSTIGNIAMFVGNVFKGTVSVLGSLKDGLTKIITNLKDVIINFLEGHGTDVAAIAEGGFLGWLVFGITKIVAKLKKLDLPKILNGIMDFIQGKNDDGEDDSLMGKIGKTFDTLSSSINKFTESIKIKVLDTVANSMIKLAAALLIISLIDSDKIGTALAGLGGAITEMLVAVNATGKIQDGGSMFSAGKAFQRIATGLIEVAIALKILSGIDPNAMAVAIAGMGVVLIELSAFLMVLGSFDSKAQGNNMPKIAKSLTSIGLGMIFIAAAMKIIGSIDAISLTKGLIGIGAVLAEIAVFMIALSHFMNDKAFGAQKITAIGDSMIRMSVGLLIIAAAMKLMSTIDGKGVDLALTQMLAAFVGIGAFTIAITKFAGAGSFIAVSTGMLIMSVALIALAGAIKALGSLHPQVVGNGLKVLAMGVGAIALVALVLGSMAGFFLLAAAGLTAFGLAVAVASAAMMTAIPVFGAFQAVGQGIGGVIVDVIGDALEAVILLIPQFFLSIIAAVISVLGKVKDLIVALFDVLIETAVELLPRVIELGAQILLSVLEGIALNIGEIVESALLILGNFIEALGNGLPDFLDKLLGFVVDVVNGLAEAIRNNGAALGAAIGNLAAAIIEAIISGLWAALGSFVSGLFSWLGEAIMQVGNGNGDVPEGASIGGRVVRSTEEGMEEKAPELVETADGIATEAVETFDKSEEAQQNGDYTIEGLAASFRDPKNAQKVFGAVTQFMDDNVLQPMLDKMEISSPSKVAMKIGNFIVQGLASGIDSGDMEVKESVYGTTSVMLDAFRSAAESADEVLNDKLNPIITPVLDLTNIRDNAALIPGLLGNGSTYDAAMSIGNYYKNAEIQNSALNKQPITMTNNFTLNGVGNIQDPSVLNNLADRLADKINIILGNAL